MNSLRDIVESSPKLRGIQDQATKGDNSPEPLGTPRWDWRHVRKVLVIRLRSIGDTVLSTSSLLALQRFLPEATVDVVVEDWVAPILDEHPYVNQLIAIERGGLASRARVAKELRSKKYDVVYNLHGGTTATLLTRATGARHRVGYASYQYANLHNHQAPSPLHLWQQEKTHSVEQQLALLGWTGVPVTDRPPTTLAITERALRSVDERLRQSGLDGKKIVLMHPAAAFDTKQWATENFARVAEFLAAAGFVTVAIAGPKEGHVLNELVSKSKTSIVTLNLSLPEVTAMAARSQLFVGNDSGIAHIASAVGTPSVVIFGSSNIAHWRPWTRSRAEVVFEEMDCQPCPGYYCAKFEKPECILRVPVSRVTAAVDRLIHS